MNTCRRRTELGGIDPVTGRGFVDGYEAVNLGLPSGLLWATCNIGASVETDYGNFYRYGDGSTVYSRPNAGSYYNGTENPLSSSYDTAVQTMGGGWRMPTQAEFSELINNTNPGTYYANQGRSYNKKQSSTIYIYFPFAGGYDSLGYHNNEHSCADLWTSTPKNNRYAYFCRFTSNNTINTLNDYRFCGYPIRAVHPAI